ncbi:MAG: 2-methylcitrate synthase, partial [Phycisphaerae bacterium]|nr:2-methylcitrate synthase [Phycisphaerae bacterium]
MTKTQEPSKKQADQRGLAGQTIGDTAVCAVNQTQLMYRGYEIADLAANATFEEVAYVLLVGEKPNAEQLTSFSQELVSMRAIPNSVKEAIISIA